MSFLSPNLPICNDLLRISFLNNIHPIFCYCQRNNKYAAWLKSLQGKATLLTVSELLFRGLLKEKTFRPRRRPARPKHGFFNIQITNESTAGPIKTVVKRSCRNMKIP